MKRHLLYLASGFWLLVSPAFAIIDANNNGLSDLWEKAHNNDQLFPNSYDPQADSDQDGWTNAEEAAAGTDPADPNPPDGLVRPDVEHIPAVFGPPDENGIPEIITPETITLTWPTIPGKKYTLLISTDLASGSWLPNSAIPPFIGNGNDVTYGFPTSISTRSFWRIKVEDADTDSDGLTDAEERSIGSSPYLADTDGNGVADAEAYAAGVNPAGDDTDSDGDGVPDKDLYSVVFEVEEESHMMPFGVGFAGLENTDDVHRYLTYKDTGKYTVSGSARYPDVTDAEHVWTYTFLANGAIQEDGQTVTSEQGVTFYDWKANHQTTLAEGESLVEDEQNATITVEGPTITATQIKTVTTTSTPWTVKKNGNVVRSGTEVVAVTEQYDVSDEVTYQGFWNTYVKPLAWKTSPRYKCGSLQSMAYNRGVFGDAVAAEYVRERFLRQDFAISGNISKPGTSYPDWGYDQRIKSLRWRWVKFNPLNPFGYEYVTPPASVRQTFHLLVSQRDVLYNRGPQGGDQSTDETKAKGILEIECKANEGAADWKEIPLTTFASHKLEDPAMLADLNFAKWGYSQVIFGNLPAAIIPDRESFVTADDHTTNIVFRMSDDVDGAIVEWQIESGTGGSLSETETTVEDGLSAVSLVTSTVKGAKYILKARIKKLSPDGEDIGAMSAWIKSPEIEVIAGKPHAFAFAKTKATYRSDGTDTSEITTTIKDQYGNLVEDGTPVTWGVDQTPTPPFDSVENATSDGEAKAVIHAPLIPDDQVVVCRAGDKQASTIVSVQRVTGSISGNLGLDIGANQQSTINVNVQAVDGTPVYWTTSNGEITAQSNVANGSASATLSASNGRLGIVVVTASVGDRLLYTEGQFTSSSGLAIGAEHPVLIADATVSGVHTPTFAHGIARQIPFYASTEIHVKGPANAIVDLTLQASSILDSWALDIASGNMTPSGTGTRGMTLTNAGIDGAVQHSGAGSLFLNGTGYGSVPDSADFHFTDQFNVRLVVRPGQHCSAALVAKDGSWQIDQLSDGRIQACVITATGTHTATTAETIPLNLWTPLSVDFRFDRLQIKLDNRIAAQVATTGTIAVTSNPIIMGYGFHGNLDSLELHAGGTVASNASVNGIEPGDTLQLDSTGEGSFTITSTGQANAGTNIHLSVDLNAGAGEEIAETIVDFADAVYWDAAYDTVMSFVGGDPQTTQGTVSSIAGGFLVVGDVGSCTKNLWRMTAWSDKQPNYVELTLGGLGVITTFADFTGVGAAADAGVASIKTLAIRFVGNAKAEKFLDVFIEQIKTAIVRGGGFGWAEANFLRKMVTDVPVADAFKLFMHDEGLARAAVRATEKLGDNAESFYQGVRRAVESHGEDVAKKFVEAFDGLGNDALNALKSAPAGELDDALDGLAKVANKGIAPLTLRRVLDNTDLYGTGYKRTNLLKDLGELAEVKGMHLLVDSLKSANNKGFRYELEGTAWLKRNQKTISEITRRIDGTDIDVVVLEGSKLIYYQFKRSSKAFYSGSKNTGIALELAKAWVGKAKADLGKLASYDQIRYATDASVTVPKKILEWFDSLEPKIVVERIPHLD